MKKGFFPLVLLWLFLPCVCAADGAKLFDELERVLNQRPRYMEQKEHRIDSLKQRLSLLRDEQSLFRLYDAIYREYYTYRFDSAMLYVDKAREVATRLSDSAAIYLNAIHRSVLLSTSGHFSESVQNLERVNVRALNRDLLVEYYAAYEWAYSMWAEYSGDNVYAPRYYREEMRYQDSLISVLPADSRLGYYWKAENLYRRRLYVDAEQSYLKALEGTPVNVRLYAMITYGLALVYEKMGDRRQYEHYLVQAAISDQVCPLKENLALQELALYIFRNDEKEVSRANRYLNYSLEDAMFYNNRLRMLEVARKFPSIVLAYQEQNRVKSERLKISLVGISLLSVGLLLSLYYIYRQMRQLRRRRKILADMNVELQHLNKELLYTNRTREEYVGLFMDLCAAYIDKLSRYQELVKRKVKAKQTEDLLKLVNATRLSDTDAKEFFLNFDTAFLNLYPNFVSSFNTLLREGEEIAPKRGELLNTELRIFALIRMGIKDSSKIATLLFYSPQTIYNHRSAVKNRARDREGFERQVEELCKVNEA